MSNSSAKMVVSVVVVNFRTLLQYWSEVLEKMGEAAEAAQEPRRASNFAEASRGVLDCQTFRELVEFLGSPTMPFDRRLRQRVVVLRQCGEERQWLNGKVGDFLRDWYAQYAEDLDSTKRIAAWVNELVAAYRVWINGDGSPRCEPQTGNWHDNQCVAWGLLTAGETPAGRRAA